MVGIFLSGTVGIPPNKIHNIKIYSENFEVYANRTLRKTTAIINHIKGKTKAKTKADTNKIKVMIANLYATA